MIHKSISKTALCIINEIDLVVDVVPYVLINCMPAGCTAYRGGVTNGGGAVAPMATDDRVQNFTKNTLIHGTQNRV